MKTKWISLFELKFWEHKYPNLKTTQNHAGYLKNLKLLFNDLFQPYDITYKISLLQNSIPAILNILINLTQEQPTLQHSFTRLLKQVQQFSAQFQKINNPVFQQDSLLKPSVELPQDIKQYILSSHVKDLNRVWICQHSKCFVRLTIPKPQQSSSRKLFFAKKKKTNDPIFTALTLDPNLFPKQEDTPTKKIVIFQNGEMFLIDEAMNTFYLSEGFPIKYVGLVRINNKGQLLEIKAIDDQYPVTDQHTEEILEHLNYLGLDTEDTKILYLKKNKAPIICSIEEARTKIEQLRKNQLGIKYQPSSNALDTLSLEVPKNKKDKKEKKPPPPFATNEKFMVVKSTDPPDYVNSLNQLKFWILENARLEILANFHFSIFLSTFIDEFSNLVDARQRLNQFLEEIDTKISDFKKTCDLAPNKLDEFDALVNKAPWTRVPIQASSPKQSPSKFTQTLLNKHPNIDDISFSDELTEFTFDTEANYTSVEISQGGTFYFGSDLKK